MTNYAVTRGGAWDTPTITLMKVMANGGSPMHRERKGTNDGFRTFRNCREKLRNG